MNTRDELTEAVRARGVRVEPRLDLLRELAEEDGPERLARRIEALRQRIRDAAQAVRGDLA